MKKFFLLFLLSLAACGRGISPPSTVQPRTDHLQVQTLAANCGQVELPSGPLKYCIEDRADTKSFLWTNVVYFFHGLGGRPESFFSPPYDNILRKIHQSLGVKAPVFISLSLGSEGIVKENAAEITRLGLPAIEKKFPHGWFLRRHLIGESMGGHNSVRVAAASPLKFRSLSLLCPALVTFDPNNEEQVQKFVENHRDVLSLDFFSYLRKIFRREFSTPEAWQANEPFHFLEQGRFRFLPTFVSVGRSDNAGFYDGAKAWVDQSLASGIRPVWFPVEGAHCAFDQEGLAKFLIDSF